MVSKRVMGNPLDVKHHLIAKVESFQPDTIFKPIYWNTDYSMKNHNDSDMLWDVILPSHGFVAMDRDWAKENGWPESMYLPSDKSKGVYLLEAYHHMHCLVSIRIPRQKVYKTDLNSEFFE